MSTARRRCPWAEGDAAMVRYHDRAWGVPERRPQALFEKLLLDGFQAGLSWRTILHKRAAMRRAFANFVPAALARFGAADEARLLADAGIVRNRQKIRAAIASARAYLRLAEAGADFAAELWQFTGGTTVHGAHRTAAAVPTQTAASAAMSAWLRARGFAFCGPVICYAFMQATGMVNDHLVHCFRHAALRAAEPRP